MRDIIIKQYERFKFKNDKKMKQKTCLKNVLISKNSHLPHYPVTLSGVKSKKITTYNSAPDVVACEQQRRSAFAIRSSERTLQ